ncbi:MAG: hypothetical protein GY769_20900 [bacterium]|nr:hypothetical protein [bacterium]
MRKRRLQKTLRQLAGHLVIESEEQQRAFDSLTRAMAEADLPEDRSAVIQSDFSIGKADLFFDETIPKQRFEALDHLADRIADGTEKPQYRMFVREVPLREPLLHGSVPPWAAGARASRSIGPFAHKDGRQFWFDFYPIVKLVALYIQGVTEPVLLFKLRRGRPSTGRAAKPVRYSKVYSLAKGSIWINARFLAPNAPTGTYVGLAIDGGRVGVNATAVEENGKLTVAANTTITVDLDLDQAEVKDANDEVPHGADARHLKLELPDKLSFHFSGHGRTIDEVGDARWELYEQELGFAWKSDAQTTYDPLLQRVVFPFAASAEALEVRECRSQAHALSGRAEIIRSAWALSVATIDVSQPTEASGTGAMLVQTKAGLADAWQGLEGGGLQLANPVFLVSPGLIFLADLTGGNPHAQQTLELWQDDLNQFGTTVVLAFPLPALFFYASGANGIELLMTFANADFQIDRPVEVSGEPPAVRSLHSLLVLAVTPGGNLIYLFDDNLIQDAALLNNQDPVIPEPMSLALTNALFKVTQANGCLLFGSLTDDFSKVENAFLFLTFGLYAYLPTLPDPYAANLGVLRRQIRGRKDVPSTAVGAGFLAGAGITAWLVCRVRWQAGADEDAGDDVEVSFHFAPLINQFAGISLEDGDEDASEDSGPAAGGSANAVSSEAAPPDGADAVPLLRLNSEISNAIAMHNRGVASAGAEDQGSLRATSTRLEAVFTGDEYPPLPDYEDIWDKATLVYRRNIFALLDVSTKADLFGVSFDFRGLRTHGRTTHVPVATTGSPFPIQVEGVDVVSQGYNVKAFTVPQISWEPVRNLSQAFVTGDPPKGPNYYPNDGGPMQILNVSENTVALAPLPLADYLIGGFDEHPDTFAAYAFLTLPFGLKALAVLQDQYTYVDEEKGTTSTRRGTDLLLNAEDFDGDIKGGLQLQLNAGEALIQGQSDLFKGSTVQLNNVRNLAGQSTGTSTLGRTVTIIFNEEFLGDPPQLIRGRGVPLTRIDLSGYGASCFSNWLNPKAAFAETSQTSFDIFVGRCAHEVIQVKSMIYPWGIQVVRTITIYKEGSAYVYRTDSGWRAESNGEFDFSYWVTRDPDQDSEREDSPFEIHPGIITGLYNVQNIIETEEIALAKGNMAADGFVDDEGVYKDQATTLEYELQPVYFDADVEIENTVTGFTTKKIDGNDKDVVPSKKIVGYVQVKPRGIPINAETLKNIVIVQLGSIGGPIDCEIDLAETSQKMRLSRFDFNNSVSSTGGIVFAAAGRGSVLLPKDGSWSMVKHERDTGEVSPVPANLSVPVVREGKLPQNDPGLPVNPSPASVLLRIANPAELLRSPADDTLNYGFLQSTDTQKALFLTPSFEKGVKKLLSKTPPLFVDAFRIVNSKAVFPNVGDAENDFGDAISLLDKGNEFDPGSLQDVGQTVYKLMDITGAFENAAEQGFDLLRKTTPFELPDEFNLIDLGDGKFRIYIEYKQGTTPGKLDFDIKSMAQNPAETWKSQMSKIGLVLDLAGIKRLVTIRGNWDSKKGSEAAYPQPDLVWADELKPVIEILEILQKIQQGDYAGAVGNGLKLAMSNKAGTWEYKFEASKEIPVLRFPPGALYNDPNAPFKLEAGLKLGAYFNAALKVTNDANELLPSAGGLLGFYGRLSVMCVSLSAATIYAIGQVNLDIAADTKIGPSLRMKFGFGAQVVVGLPVAGNVSVLFVVGVEIFAASGIVEVTAFMLFEGHAEILGGLIGITIRIEAKGTVSRKALPGNKSRADLACQVTFGLDISIFLVINISFETSWSEQRQIA